MKKRKNTLQKHLVEIKREHDIVFTKENYKDMLPEELESTPILMGVIKHSCNG